MPDNVATNKYGTKVTPYCYFMITWLTGCMEGLGWVSSSSYNEIRASSEEYYLATGPNTTEIANWRGVVCTVLLYIFGTLTTQLPADPDLTDIGIQQANDAHDAWVAETQLEIGIPLPEKLYCSPMTRALHTHLIIFDGIVTSENRKTTVLEVWFLFA